MHENFQARFCDVWFSLINTAYGFCFAFNDTLLYLEILGSLSYKTGEKKKTRMPS